MADVKVPESIPCQFDKDGWRPCGRASDNGWCSEHEDLRCISCEGKATRSCNMGMSGLCCGVPLCDNCEHEQSTGNHVTKAVPAAAQASSSEMT